MIYSKYTDRIKEIVQKKTQRSHFQKGSNNQFGIYPSLKSKNELFTEQRNFSKSNQLNAGLPISNILHPTIMETAEIGLHPSFKHLKGTSNTENHYIVSVFIDIAGSTKLFGEYELEEIFIITNTIQSAAIHTCLSLGGQIQRLQGDGVFAYFGGKGISKKEAVEMAVTASGMITYFVKNDIEILLFNEEIEGIKTRIGIDFGDDHEVLWANFGLMNVSELTTLSLHTSLASKMQSFAKKNGINVGQKIKDILQVDDKLFDLVKNSKGEIVKRYIYEDQKNGIYYTQYCFDWLNYLKTLPFIGTENNGDLYIITAQKVEEIRLQKLRTTAAAINTSSAFTNSKGHIATNNTGVKNQDHQFHYG